MRDLLAEGGLTRAPAVNIVCLTGQLAGTAGTGIPMETGWSTRVLKVPRGGLEDEEEAGVFSVAVVLPPALASEAMRERYLGRWVAIVGMLAVDVDYSDDTPRFHHAVVARSIEALPDASASD